MRASNRRFLLLFALSVCVVLLRPAQSRANPTTADDPTGAQRFRVPVAGSIVDTWRPPANPYAAGNRGVELATADGAVVTSPGEGIVSFAGQVGGVRYVVTSHPGGVRFTLGGLASVIVSTGDRVIRGQPVGTAGTRLHLGARVGNGYVDPRPYFRGPARLVR